MDFDDALTAHSVFKNLNFEKAEDTTDVGTYCNLIYYHEASRILLLSNSVQLRAISLPKNSKNIGNNWIQTYSQIEISPSDKLYNLQLNHSGNFLALQEKSKIKIIDFDSLKIQFSQKEIERVNAKPFTVIKPFNVVMEKKELIIRKMAWHPLSDKHLVVLTSDNFLRIYNITEERSEPEQKYAIQPEKNLKNKRSLGSYPLTFTFGKSTEVTTWIWFTIFIQMNTGEIYALCPVVPFGCIIPISFINDLLDYEKKRIPLDRDSILWLKKIKTPQQNKRLSVSASHTKAYYHSKQQNFKMSAKSSESDDEKNEHEDYEEDVKDVKEVREKDNNSNNSNNSNNIFIPAIPANAVLQGPINSSDIHPDVASDIHNPYFDVSDIQLSQTTPPCLIRVFNDGLIEIFLFTEEIRPQWLKTNIKESKQDPIILYKSYDLDLPLQKSSKEIIPPYLYIDQLKPYIFYTYHAYGVHRINASWIKSLGIDPKKNEKQISFPEVLLRNLKYESDQNQANLVKFVGAAYMYDPWVGRHFILMDQAGHCDIININIEHITRKVNQLSLDSKLDQSLAGFEFKLPAKQQPKIKSSLVMADKPEEVIKFLSQNTSELYNSYIPYIHQCSNDITKRVEVLQRIHALNLKQIDKMQKDLILFNKNQEIINQKLIQFKKGSDNLSKRMDNMLWLMVNLPSTLSPAEVEYFNVLEEKEKEVNEKINVIDSLYTSVQHLAPDIQNYRMPKRKIKEYQSILLEQATVIDKMVKVVKNLNEKLKNN